VNRVDGSRNLCRIWPEKGPRIFIDEATLLSISVTPPTPYYPK
jgi:hypothetical protein